MVYTPWNLIPWGFHRGKNPWEIHGILVAQTPWIFHGARTMELHSMGASYGQKPMETLWWISMTYISWKWIPCGFYSCETYRNLTKKLWHINHDISIIDISRQLSFKGASTGQTHGNKMELFRTIQKFANVMVSYNDETISTNIWNGLEKCSAAFIMEIT